MELFTVKSLENGVVDSTDILGPNLSLVEPPFQAFEFAIF
jgi:hypothetical protein